MLVAALVYLCLFALLDLRWMETEASVGERAAARSWSGPFPIGVQSPPRPPLVRWGASW